MPVIDTNMSKQDIRAFAARASPLFTKLAVMYENGDPGVERAIMDIMMLPRECLPRKSRSLPDGLEIEHPAVFDNSVKATLANASDTGYVISDIEILRTCKDASLLTSDTKETVLSLPVLAESHLYSAPTTQSPPHPATTSGSRQAAQQSTAPPRSSDVPLPAHGARRNPAPSNSSPPSASVDPPDPQEAQLRKTAKAVNKLVMDGYLSKAMQRLLRSLCDKLADVTEMNNILSLLHLHPVAPAEPLPRKSDNNRLLTVDDEILFKALKTIDNGSAPGPSLWSPKYLHEIALNPEAKKGIVALLRMLLNDEMSAELKQLFLASHLLAIPKIKDGAQAGLRPIAVGDVFLRLASRVAFSKLPSGQRLFPNNIQMGCNIKGGPQAAIHAIQTALHAHKDNVLLTSDFKNAFNKINRIAVIKALLSKEAVKDVHSIFYSLYSQAAPLLIFDKQGRLHSIISSDTGVRQGDALASLAYDLTVEHIYARIKKDHTDVVVIAVHDDLHFVGRPDAVLRAFNKLQLLCSEPSLGLSLCTSKCVLFHPARQAPSHEHLKTLAAEAGIQFKSGRIVVLGTPIGEDKDDITATLKEKTDAYLDRCMTVLTHKDIHPKTAYTLITKCVIPKMMHIARTLLPSSAHQIMRHFDNKVLTLVSKVLKLPANMPAHLRAHIGLPVSKGGLAIRQYSSLHKLAFTSALLESKFIVRHCLQTMNIVNHQQDAAYDPSSLRNEPSFREARECLSSLASTDPETIAKLIPSSRCDLTGLPHKQGQTETKLQDKLTAVLDAATTQQLCNDKDYGRDGALTKKLASLSAHPSARYFLTRPPDVVVKQHHMSPNDFQLAIRHNLLLPVIIDEQKAVKCELCGHLTKQLPDHPLSCEALRKRSVNNRHEALAALLVKGVFTDANLTATTFARISVHSAKAADIFVSTPRYWLASDVSIVHEGSPSYIDHAVGADVKARENAKRRKYSEVVKHMDFGPEKKHFVPFVANTDGVIGKEGNRFLDILTPYANMFDPVTAKDGFKKKYKELIHFLIIKQNMLIYHEYAALCAIQKHHQTKHSMHLFPLTNPAATMRRNYSVLSQPKIFAGAGADELDIDVESAADAAVVEVDARSECSESDTEAVSIALVDTDTDKDNAHMSSPPSPSLSPRTSSPPPTAPQTLPPPPPLLLHLFTPTSIQQTLDTLHKFRSQYTNNDTTNTSTAIPASTSSSSPSSTTTTATPSSPTSSSSPHTSPTLTQLKEKNIPLYITPQHTRVDLTADTVIQNIDTHTNINSDDDNDNNNDNNNTQTQNSSLPPTQLTFTPIHIDTNTQPDTQPNDTSTDVYEQIIGRDDEPPTTTHANTSPHSRSQSPHSQVF